MKNDDTITAVSTPPGKGGIAVVRISGAEAVSLIGKIFSGSDLKKSESHRAHHGWIMDGTEPIDEAVVTIFRAPHSYTGEDVVEIGCHGGAFVGQRIVEILVDRGARPARPGEFTERAFIHGRMNLCQAEAVADLIQARTEASRKVAAYQLQGRLSDRIMEMREFLTKACSLLEVELDFGEEDVKFASRDELTAMLGGMREEMDSILASFDRGRICREGIRMVIVGRPNVGKSSILNALVERERAIVTETPGTTRDTVEDILDIRGILFVITDTAGIREVKDPVEKLGVQRARQALEASDVVLLVFDGSEVLTAEDEAIIRLVEKTDKKVIACVNKIDLPQKIDMESLEKRLSEKSLLKVSALKRTGFPELTKMLETIVLTEGIPHAGEIVLTRTRHRDCMQKAKESIEHAERSLMKGMSQEFIAVDLRAALDALGEITGQTTTDDILNRIFSEFCIGK